MEAYSSWARVWLVPWWSEHLWDLLGNKLLLNLYVVQCTKFHHQLHGTDATYPRWKTMFVTNMPLLWVHVENIHMCSIWHSWSNDKRYVDISSYNAHHHDQLVSPQQHTNSYLYSSSASGLRVNGLSEINHWTYTCAIFTSKNVLLEHRLHRCCEVLQTHTCM